MILLTILNTMIPAAAVALVAWIAMRLLRVNAATRHWVWWSVLAIVALPFLRIDSTPVPTTASAPVTLPVAPADVERFDWLLWVAAAWAGFAVYRLARIAWGFVQMRAIKNAARPADSSRLEHWRQACGVTRPVALMVSDRIQLPMAVGFLRPAVILPENLTLSPDEMDHVLLHELAHIARRDDWTNLAARAVGVVLGLHPVAAFALARIERERELACDDFVVAATGEARSYAESLTHLFEMARGQRQPAVINEMASGVMGSRLGDRVEQLLTRGRRFERGASTSSFLAIAAALLGIAFVGEHLPGWVAFAQEPPRPVVRAAPATPVTPAPAAAPKPVTRAQAVDPQMQRMEALMSRLEALVEQLSRVTPGKLIAAPGTEEELMKAMREEQEIARAREMQRSQVFLQRELYEIQRKLEELHKAQEKR